MRNESKKEYLEAIKARYRNSSRLEKQIILDEFCNRCAYNPKYAIRLINANSRRKKKKRPGRKRKYHNEEIQKFLKILWRATQ